MSVKTRRVRAELVDTPLTKYRLRRACGVCAEVKAQQPRDVTLVCGRCVAVGEVYDAWTYTKVYCARTPEEAYSRRVALELMK